MQNDIERKNAGKKCETDILRVLLPLFGSDAERFKLLYEACETDPSAIKDFYDQMDGIFRKHKVIMAYYPISTQNHKISNGWRTSWGYSIFKEDQLVMQFDEYGQEVKL